MSNVYDSTGLYDQSAVAFDGGIAPNFGLPTVGVFIAFNDSPYVAEPGWEDVTQYVRQIPSIRRARSDDWSAFTGTATVVLSNRDQRFNPFNTSSPYNGKLKPRRQIKIVAVSGENSYTLFRGYIAGWPVDWSEQGLDSTVTIECFDALALLAVESTKNLADVYVRSLNPRNYYPCDDPINPLTYRTQTIKDYGSDPRDLIPDTTLTYPTGTSSKLADGLFETCVDILTGTADSSWYFATTALAATDATYMFWFSKGLTSAPQYEYFFRGGTSFDVSIAFDKTNNRIEMFVYDGSTVYEYRTNTFYLDITQPHHVAIGVTSSKTISFLYVDGASYALTYVGSSAVGTTVTYNIQLNAGKRQQVCLFTRLLSQTEIQTTYALSIGLIQESTATRFNRIIGTTSFPTSLTSAPSSPEGTVAQFTTPEANIINELTLIRNSEGGELYTSKDGVLTLTNRNSQLKGRSATTQASFKDDGTALKYADNFNLGFDADSVVNDLRLSITGGAEIIGTDSASQSLVGRKTYSLDTQLAGIADAQSLANARVAIFGDPIPTVSPLQVGKTRVQADWQTLLGLELLDQIEVTRTPTSGSVFSDRLLINEISHTISPDDWDMTITGSARYSEWFTIDVDFIDGDRLIA